MRGNPVISKLTEGKVDLTQEYIRIDYFFTRSFSSWATDTDTGKLMSVEYLVSDCGNDSLL